MGSTSLQKMPFLLQTTLYSFVLICRLSTASLSKVNTHLLLKPRTSLLALLWSVPGTTTTSSLTKMFAGKERNEIVLLFLAVLHLIKLQHVTLQNHETEGTMIVKSI